MTLPVIPEDARLEIFGLPHHGKVKGGKLLFPSGGIKMDYPQPGPSNVLLAKVKELPDRTGNALDAENFFEWKDRLLLQIGNAGTVPMAIPADHIVCFDAADVAWLVKLEVTIAGLTFTLKATLVRQYMLIAEEHAPDFNHLFFTASGVDLSAFVGSHGLASLSGLQFASQNPRGNKVLIGIGGTFGTPVSLSDVIARIAELTISGTVDRETGLGLAGSLSTWKDVGQCVQELQEVPLTQDYKVRFLKGQESRSCTGVPGTGTITVENEMDPGMPADDQAPPDVNGYYYFDGEVGTIDVQKWAVSGFYDEQGDAKLVEVQSAYRASIDEFDDWTYSYELIKHYDVTEHIPPIARWEGQGENTATVNSSEVDTNISKNIEAYAMELIIDGDVKERIELVTSQFYSEIYSKTVSEPRFSDGLYYYECSAYASGWSDQFMIPRPRALPDPVANGYTEDITTWTTYELIANGSVIWTDNDFRTDPPPFYRQLSNRVFGLIIGAALAADAGVKRWWGAHADKHGIQGQVDEYAAFDPFSETVATDADPIGFV